MEALPLLMEPIDGGFRLFEQESHYVDLLQMIYTWRLVTTSKRSPLTYDRHWCYETYLGAVVAAILWQEFAEDDEPQGWVKAVHTDSSGRRIERRRSDRDAEAGPRA